MNSLFEISIQEEKNFEELKEVAMKYVLKNHPEYLENLNHQKIKSR